MVAPTNVQLLHIDQQDSKSIGLSLEEERQREIKQHRSQVRFGVHNRASPRYHYLELVLLDTKPGCGIPLGTESPVLCLAIKVLKH